MVDKGIIKRNFSRHAEHYDRYADVQNLLAVNLIKRLGSAEVEKILDIGCGTGAYTKLLRDRFPFAEIKALDISGEMLNVARSKLHGSEIEFIQGDAEIIDIDEEFDLITANASFQWFECLERTLIKYRRLLRENGVILFSLFGYLTLYELQLCLRELFENNVSISSCEFIDKKNLKDILGRHFREYHVEEGLTRKQYSSLWELLSKIKYTGTRGCGINGKNFSRSEVMKLEKIYKNRFKELTATYQVYYCRASK